MISVSDHRELQAAVLAMKAADREIKREINRATVATMGPEWKALVNEHLSGMSAMSTRMLGVGTRIKGGNPPVAMAANSKRAVGSSKRLVPATDFAAWEFGADRAAVSTYKRKSKNGGTHQVKRHASRGLPARAPKGRAIYPAFKEIAPRMVSLWVQIIVKKYYEASEGKS